MLYLHPNILLTTLGVEQGCVSTDEGAKTSFSATAPLVHRSIDLPRGMLTDNARVTYPPGRRAHASRPCITPSHCPSAWTTTRIWIFGRGAILRDIFQLVDQVKKLHILGIPRGAQTLEYGFRFCDCPSHVGCIDADLIQHEHSRINSEGRSRVLEFASFKLTHVPSLWNVDWEGRFAAG